MSTSTPFRYRDRYTAALGVLASEWESQHRAYQAATLRALHVEDAMLREVVETAAAGSMALREEIGKRMARTLRKHPLYPWMAAHRNFPKAAHTARLIQAIGDPLRFPGRVCSEGHHLPADYVGVVCPVRIYAGTDGNEERDAGKPCGATVGPIRRGTGVRALWHYCGCHVVDGKLPKQRRGQQGDWNPAVRDALLKPDVGIAAQIVRQRIEPWRTIYDEAKERIGRERGAEQSREIEARPGPALRPIQVDQRARMIAVKAMLGDLLVEWKRVVTGARRAQAG